MIMGDAGKELVDFAKKVAVGKETKAEINRQDCLSIYVTTLPPCAFIILNDPETL